MQSVAQIHKRTQAKEQSRKRLGKKLRKNIIADSTKKGKRSYDEMQLGDAPSYDMPDFMDC